MNHRCKAQGARRTAKGNTEGKEKETGTAGRRGEVDQLGFQEEMSKNGKRNVKAGTIQDPQ
jgi:hypothetical protein